MQVYRAGDQIEDLCRACKIDRAHTVIVVDPGGRPLRVQCDYCASQHNYRGGSRPSRPAAPRSASRAVAPYARPTPEAIAPAAEGERTSEPTAMSPDPTPDLENLLRRIFREETGLTPVSPAEKWRGGTLVLRPANASLQEKSWPIDTFFHKVVMLRNRLRTLEQQVNGMDVPEDVKVKLQAYITGCYGSLTSFNVLFADEADHFKGVGAD
jgi:methylphosphotriester-DNA--protein-cysteine methyltransferase